MNMSVVLCVADHSQEAVVIVDAIHNAERLKGEVDDAKVKLDELKEEIVEIYCASKNDVRTAFEKLHEALTAREELILHKLECKQKEKLDSISETHDQLSTFLTCIQTEIEKANTFLVSASQLTTDNEEVVSTLCTLRDKFPSYVHHSLQVTSNIIYDESLLQQVGMLDISFNNESGEVSL